MALGMKRAGAATLPPEHHGLIVVTTFPFRTRACGPRWNVLAAPNSNLAHSTKDSDMKHLNHYPGRKTANGRMAALASPRIAGAGIALAAAALFVASRSRKAERDYPPEGKFIEVEGVRLHYLEKGEGVPLVLLHGNTTMGMDFTLSGLVDMAAKRYRVIVFDRPGYGYSERPRSTIWNCEAQARLLNGALEKIGAQRAIVLGHSLGALVAIAMALDFPQSVRSLVLSSGYYYPTLRPEVPFTSQPAIPVLGDIMRYTVTPLTMRMLWPLMLKREFTPAPVSESMKKLPPWLVLRPSQIRASSAEMILLYPDVFRLGRRYAELKLPIVLVAGSGDRLVYRSRHSDRFHRELPHTDYRIIEGSGHMVHHVAPEKVLQAIDAAAAADSGARGIAKDSEQAAAHAEPALSAAG
jgi:pimeloyl-ACP methyl ester carboxylesterase